MWVWNSCKDAKGMYVHLSFTFLYNNAAKKALGCNYIKAENARIMKLVVDVIDIHINNLDVCSYGCAALRKLLHNSKT